MKHLTVSHLYCIFSQQRYFSYLVVSCSEEKSETNNIRQCMKIIMEMYMKKKLVLFLLHYFIKKKKKQAREIFFRNSLRVELHNCNLASAVSTKRDQKSIAARLVTCAKRDASVLIRTLRNIAIKKSRKTIAAGAVKKKNEQQKCRPPLRRLIRWCVVLHLIIIKSISKSNYCFAPTFLRCEYRVCRNLPYNLN